MRSILVLSLCATCAGCFNPVTTTSQTPLQKYETALHVYQLEFARRDKIGTQAALDTTDDKGTAVEGAAKDSHINELTHQSDMRIKRAQKFLDEAESALPK